MIKYNKALVIGKFQPLHKGHLSLIDFATTKANKVLVCVTAHKKEIISLNQRLFWVKKVIHKMKMLVFVVFRMIRLY